MGCRNSILLACCFLAACGTPDDFTRGMAEPAQALQRSADIAEEAEHDILQSYFIGMLDEAAGLGAVVCIPWSGTALVSAELGLFGQAVETVRLVGTTSNDPGYAGYVRSMATRSDALASLSPAAQETEQQATAMQEQRCQQLFAADVAAEPALKSLDTGPAALIVALAPLLAFDVLVKTILTDAGILQREVAVRAAISALIPRLTAANQGLRAAPNAAFGPMVRYAPGSANSDAAAMNATNLGATINIRRWFLARQIATQSAYLGPCRRKERSDCLADPTMRGVARAISGNVRLYRAVARIDTQAITTALDEAIEVAKDSIDPMKNPARLIDSLLTLSSSMTDVSRAYAQYNKTVR